MEHSKSQVYLFQGEPDAYMIYILRVVVSSLEATVDKITVDIR